MSEKQPEAAHDGGAGPSDTPTSAGLPSELDEQPSAEGAGGEDAESRSIPIGSPVDAETFAELKRRAERPDEDAPPAQEDPS